jgi:hypothetical protein
MWSIYQGGTEESIWYVHIYLMLEDEERLFSAFLTTSQAGLAIFVSKKTHPAQYKSQTSLYQKRNQA